ncbi:MAG: AAA family ATPase [Bacilli bacterium]|nr:AAA family ATPase [Bacilli bacterium]
MNNNEFLWSQRYRPTTIENCILPESIKSIFKGFINQGEIPNLLLAGGAGTGKTTSAYVLCNMIGADVLFINASNENGIDIVRNKLTQFASSVSLEGCLKVVILDEAERGTSAFQDALKSFMETFSENTRFILTTNNINKIIDPIISRCTTVNFKIEKSEQQKLAIQLMKRLELILIENSVQYDKKVLSQLILKYFPDFRKTINELQRYSVNGSIIDIGILSALSNTSIDELVKYLKEKDFTSARKWVANNNDGEPSALFRAIYDRCASDLQPTSIPEMILILAKYSYQSSLVVDHEINNMGCIVEIMSSCNFK